MTDFFVDAIKHRWEAHLAKSRPQTPTKAPSWRRGAKNGLGGEKNKHGGEKKKWGSDK